ncbi:MAG: hypothetical protein RLZZ453_685 [Chlamydiota bacterium]
MTAASILLERFPELFFLVSYGESTSTATAIASKEEITKHLSTLPLSHLSTIYLYGIGEGTYYELLKPWLGQAKEHRLIILQENMDELRAFCERQEAPELFNDRQVIVRSYTRNICLDAHVQALVSAFPCDRLEVVTSYAKKTPYFRRLRLELLRKSTLSWAVAMESLQYPKLMANVLANFPFVSQSAIVNRWKGRFEGIPAIICGAGPSLHKEIASLKQLEDQALIMAGGSTMTALSYHGIEPHLALAIDPNKEEFHRLKEANFFHTPLIYGSRLEKDVLNLWSYDLGYLISDTGGPCERHLEQALNLEDLPVGPELGMEALSITTLAIAMAVHMGCNPIILCGIDLAYTDSAAYTTGILSSSTDAMDTRSSERKCSRKDIHGRSIQTAVKWIMESECISTFAKMHPKTRFINVSQGGLGFKGIENSSLGKMCFKEARDLRGKVHAEMQRAQSGISLATIHEKKAEIRESLQSLLDLCKEALQEIESSLEFPTPRFTLLEYEMQEKSAWHSLNPFLDPILDTLSHRLSPDATSPQALALAKLNTWRGVLEEQLLLFPS